MTYQCPKGHQSSDSDYCSECGALIGQPKISKVESLQAFNSSNTAGSKEKCPDCGTPRTQGARFCEVCRHDFQENKTGDTEAIVASQQALKPSESSEQTHAQIDNTEEPLASETAKASESPKAAVEQVITIVEKLSVVITVDKDKASSSEIETSIKPDNVDRVFPLDLEENLLGRRSTSKGIYPEIVINDPGVSHRHLMFIKQPEGSFSVLELGSANGTELNGTVLEPGINTPVKAGDELNIGIWTKLKLVTR